MSHPVSGAVGGVRRGWWLVRTLVRCGLIAPLRPDRYLRMAAVMMQQGTTPMTGIGLSAARRPHAAALVDERGTMTYAELHARSDALAVGLTELATGGDVDTVAILCRNHRGFVEALTASSRIGADALLLNTGFSGPQLTDVLVREQASVIVYDEEFAALVEHARTQLPDLVEVVAWTDGTAKGPTVDDLVEQHRKNKPGRPKRRGRIVLLTSGTTGTPKGARRSAGGGAGVLAAMVDRIPWRAEETVVVAAPMFHAWGFGQLAFAATLSCTVVMRRRFDPRATLELVERHRATGLSVVPVMLERIVELADDVLECYRLDSLRFVSASGSRMRSDAVLRFMDRYGDIVYNSYNATEAGLICTATPADLRAAPDTAGRALVGTRLRIVDDDMRELPAGEPGRILVLSDSKFEGYTSGDTKDFAEDYMVSGDVGYLDDSGRLFVVGRDDDMIVSGGENVYPTEVEETISAHPAVLEAAAVPVDDEEFGQRLAAFVVLKPGQDLSADAVKQHVKEHLAAYKAPRDVTFVQELPRNAAGKVVRRELTAGSGRQRQG